MNGSVRKTWQFILRTRSVYNLGVVCRLRRIQSSRYEIGLQMQAAVVQEATYTSLVRAGPTSPILELSLTPEQ